MKKLLVLFLVVTSFCASAQKLEGQARIDSLQKELQNAKDDTNNVLLLIEVASSYYYIDPSTG